MSLIQVEKVTKVYLLGRHRVAALHEVSMRVGVGDSFGGGGGLVRPKLNWTFAKNTVVGIGVEVLPAQAMAFSGAITAAIGSIRKCAARFLAVPANKPRGPGSA